MPEIGRLLHVIFETCSYVIFIQDATFYAKNVKTGVIEFQGADARTVIQACIDATTTDGGKVFLTKGTYSITTPVIMKNKVVLEGEGKAATILYLADGSNCDMIQTTGELWQSPIIKNMKLDGNKANNPTGGYGISINTSQHGTLEHLDITNTKKASIYIVGTVGYNTLGTRYYDVNIENSDAMGIEYGTWAFDGLLVNCNVGNNGSHGIALGSSSQMVNCHAWGNTGCGVLVYMMQRVSISMSVIEGNGEHGVWLFDAQSCRVVANVIEDNAVVTDPSLCVALTGASQYNVVFGNIGRDTRGTKRQNGFAEADTSDYNKIMGNVVQGYKTYDYLIIGAHTNTMEYVGDVYNIGATLYQDPAVATNPATEFSVLGDAAARLMIDHAGKHAWGDGSGADAWLERTAAGIMKFTDKLDVNTEYRVANTKVVGARGAGVYVPADITITGVAEDGTCRTKVNALIAVVDDLLARLRTHGLIAP